jgi:hypothetical protein
MAQPPIYLDDNGEPIEASATPVYLDDDGNAIEPPLTRERPAPRHPHTQFPGMVGDFVTGAAKELAEQGIRGGQVLRKIPGVSLLDRIVKPIPVNTQPTNAIQRAGGAALNAAEVMAPTRALTSLGLKMLPRVAAQGVTALRPRWRQRLCSGRHTRPVP